jgi:SpoVK/Ycf46/Vps4 family AAA+-type ATPase
LLIDGNHPSARKRCFPTIEIETLILGSAIFTGLSGSGKTFSPKVIAQLFALLFFVMESGLIIHKYIGETEKNFNVMFLQPHD